MPASGPGRWCKRRVDVPEETYQGCEGPYSRDPTLPPGHAAFLADFSAAWRSGHCSGFGTHHVAALLDALGVDPARSLTVTLLRHPTDRVISHYYFALRNKHGGVRGLEPANATDFSGLLRFAAVHTNRATRQLADARNAMGCAWPHVVDATALSGEQLLQRAQRRLNEFCLVLIQVR